MNEQDQNALLEAQQAFEEHHQFADKIQRNLDGVMLAATYATTPPTRYLSPFWEQCLESIRNGDVWKLLHQEYKAGRMKMPPGIKVADSFLDE